MQAMFVLPSTPNYDHVTYPSLTLFKWKYGKVPKILFATVALCDYGSMHMAKNVLHKSYIIAIVAG